MRPLWTYRVHRRKIRRTEVHHVDALNAHIGAGVGSGSLRVRARKELRSVRSSHDREGVRAGDAHGDVPSVVHDRPTPRSGAQEATGESSSEPWAVVIRLWEGHGVGRGADKHLQGVVYPCLNRRNDYWNSQIVDASSVTTALQIQRLR